MLPEWMKENESYQVVGDSTGFIIKTIRSLGSVMARIASQQSSPDHSHITSQQAGSDHSHMTSRQDDSDFKHTYSKGKSRKDWSFYGLLFCIIFILILSWNQNTMVLLCACAMVQLLLCSKKAETILSVLKAAFLAAFLSALLFLPAMLMRPEGLVNNMKVIGKVFLSVELLSMFHHGTQWNHITRALRRLHVPGIFIFTLDITLKYIVLLGNLLTDILTALQLRSVGKNKRKQQSVGGVMGLTFLRSVEMSHQMYEAMQCRGYTDDYDGL